MTADVLHRRQDIMNTVSEDRRVVAKGVSSRLSGILDPGRACEGLPIHRRLSLMQQINPTTVEPPSTNFWTAGISEPSAAYKPDFPSDVSHTTVLLFHCLG